MKKLFLDDIRDVAKVYPGEDGWEVVRSFEEAVSWILFNGVPETISFDHDLGEGKTGFDFAKWLVESDQDDIIHLDNLKNVLCHSANPVGYDNIMNYLPVYLHYKESNRG